MKYFSVVFLAAALTWTWRVVHGTPSVSFETHSAIQEKLAELLLTTIQQQDSSLKEIQINRVWTELMTGDRIRAHFDYSYSTSPSDESGSAEKASHPTRSYLEGVGILERSPGEEKDEDRWVLQQIQILNDRVEFREPLVVSTAGKSATAPSEVGSPDEPSGEPESQNSAPSPHAPDSSD